MKRRQHVLIILLVAVIVLCPQVADALAPAMVEANQSAGGVGYDEIGGQAAEHIRHTLGQAIHVSERSSGGNISVLPSASFPGHNHCGPDLGACPAITPASPRILDDAGHRSFGKPPAQRSAGFLPSQALPPPKTASWSEWLRSVRAQGVSKR